MLGAKPTRRKLSILIGLSLFSFVIYVHIKDLPLINSEAYLESYNRKHIVPDQTKTLLLWNSFFQSETWGQPYGTLQPEYLKNQLKCAVYDCIVTNDHSFLQRIEDFNAVLFHVSEPFPIFNRVPKKRKKEQLYVFATMESPGFTKHYFKDEIGFYNWTMTVRLDSDIIWPYQYIRDRETKEIISPAKYPKWKTPSKQWNSTNYYENFRNKTKSAVWFVSHCNTLSKRETLVAELKKYIDVDIYGKCGTLQ